MMFCVFVYMYMCFCVLCKICSRVGKRGTALCSDVLSVHTSKKSDLEFFAMMDADGTD